MSDYIIETEGLDMRYRTETLETLALNKVALKIKRGEFISIMGPSGCGKSTLLNVLAMLDKPTAGHYYFDGTDISNFSERERAKIRKAQVGFVFQSFNLIDELSVYENVELPLLYLRKAKAERQK